MLSASQPASGGKQYYIGKGGHPSTHGLRVESGPIDLNKPIKHVQISLAQPIHLRWLPTPEVCVPHHSGQISIEQLHCCSRAWVL